MDILEKIIDKRMVILRIIIDKIEEISEIIIVKDINIIIKMEKKTEVEVEIKKIGIKILVKFLNLLKLKIY